MTTMTTEEQKRIFSNNLNKYISRSGKQQKEIAEAIGINASTFNMRSLLIATNKQNLENCENACKYSVFDTIILGNNIFIRD